MHIFLLQLKKRWSGWDFPCGPVFKNPFSNAGDVGLNPGWRTKDPICHKGN